MSDSITPELAEAASLLAQATSLIARAMSRRRTRAAAPAAPVAAPPPAPPAAATPAFLTTSEAAQRLGMSKKGLEQLRARGKGPRYVRVGNAVRYPVEALLESGKEPLQ